MTYPALAPASPTPSASARRVERRLALALGVSLLLHGVVLLLQFGVPGLGMLGTPPPLTVRIDANAAQPTAVAPPAEPESASAPPAAPTLSVPATGMRIVEIAPPVPPPVPQLTPTPAVRRILKPDQPRRARRISTPMPVRDLVLDPTPVIALDATSNDFAMPVARPEEAQQKSLDLQAAREGDNDGDADTSAAQETHTAKAGQAEAEEQQRLAAQATERAAEEAARLRALEQAQAQLQAQQAEQLRVDQAADLQRAQQQVAQQARERERAAQDEQVQQRAAQQRVAQQRVVQERVDLARLDQERMQQEQLRVAQQREVQQREAQQRVEQERLRLARELDDKLRAQQQLAQQREVVQQQEREQIERLRLAQQAVQQQKATQQKVEQQRAEQQKAEQQRAEQQKAEQAAAQRRSDQLAQQQKAFQERAEQAEQDASRQRAAAKLATEQKDNADRLAAERARNAAGKVPGNGGADGLSGGPGGSGARAQLPRNAMGSDLANRARDLLKGIDVLKGDPPAQLLRDKRRVAVGANERDLPLKMYVESWRQKIERNASLNYPRSWADQRSGDLSRDILVSVALRSDGSVDDVVILRSSGIPDMDEAVRRIVRVNARYAPFPADIAQRYDVIDVRRVWRFGEALKLMEELR